MRRCQLPAISNPHTHVPIADNEETCFCLFSQLHQQEEKKRRAVDAFLCCATEKLFRTGTVMERTMTKNTWVRMIKRIFNWEWTNALDGFFTWIVGDRMKALKFCCSVGRELKIKSNLVFLALTFEVRILKIKISSFLVWIFFAIFKNFEEIN